MHFRACSSEGAEPTSFVLIRERLSASILRLFQPILAVSGRARAGSTLAPACRLPRALITPCNACKSALTYKDDIERYCRTTQKTPETPRPTAARALRSRTSGARGEPEQDRKQPA